MAATRAQKIRLSAFLIVVTAIIASTLFYLVGAHLMEIRDEYKIELQGGSGGLEVGSQVRFNDIVAGRVESVRLDKDDPNLVIIWVSMEHGTPITVDTIAVPEMANITGSKMLSMRGGTKGDFIYRETTPDGIEVLSIMFEMKNQDEDTKTKHKNEDFFKKLDSDRNKKKCEFAILVSTLEEDNDLYNDGIVDISHSGAVYGDDHFDAREQSR